jgi:hypothetical protein
MQAKVGDRLVVHGSHLAEHVRDGLIVEVRGADGAAPYLVRWSEDGHESLVFPGPGTTVVPAAE